MNKKSNYLIIALIFIVLAMGWQLYIRTQPTEKEQEEIKIEAEKIPEPEGYKIYEKNSKTHESSLFIGVQRINSSNANCNFILPNGAESQEYMEVGEGFGFFDKNGESFDIRLMTINNENYGKGYVIFDIKKGTQLDHPYLEKQKDEKLQTDKNVIKSEELIKQLYSIEEDEVELKIEDTPDTDDE